MPLNEPEEDDGRKPTFTPESTPESDEEPAFQRSLEGGQEIERPSSARSDPGIVRFRSASEETLSAQVNIFAASEIVESVDRSR